MESAFPMEVDVTTSLQQLNSTAVRVSDTGTQSPLRLDAGDAHTVRPFIWASVRTGGV